MLRCGRGFLRHRGVYLLCRGLSLRLGSLSLRLGSLGLLRRHDLGSKRRQNVVRQHFFFDGRFDTVFQRHVVQQEAQAVVADRQFQIVVTVLCHFVDEVLDLLLRKILSAAVQMEDPHRLSLPSAARRKGSCRKQAHCHNEAEQDCK